MCEGQEVLPFIKLHVGLSAIGPEKKKKKKRKWWGEISFFP
jgi:hypothetical protein